MDKLGKLVNEKREKRGETLAQMAKAIKCSAAFARHIEASPIVPISQRLADGLAKHYSLNRKELAKAVQTRNRVGKSYYRQYNKARQKLKARAKTINAKANKTRAAVAQKAYSSHIAMTAAGLKGIERDSHFKPGWSLKQLSKVVGSDVAKKYLPKKSA